MCNDINLATWTDRQTDRETYKQIDGDGDGDNSPTRQKLQKLQKLNIWDGKLIKNQVRKLHKNCLGKLNRLI